MIEGRTTSRAALARALALALAWVGAPGALAQSVPSIMNYQGRLTDNTPQQTPIHMLLPMAFSIHDSGVGGAPLWSENWPAVTVVNGIFSVLLGSSGSPIPASVFTGGTSRYLEIAVNGETLTPRQQLGAAGWAARAETAAGTDCTDCIGSQQIADGSIAGADIAPDAIGDGQLASGSVGASELAAASVDASKLTTDAVKATHIAVDAVGASEIATDAVGDLELNSADQFTFNGGVILEAAGPEFTSRVAGVRKLEFWADPGYSYFYHQPAASYLLVNDTTGNWGINTTAPQDRFHVNGGSVRANAFVDANSPGFLVDPASTSVLSALSASVVGATTVTASTVSATTVSAGSLDVSGTTFVGWQIVSASYAVNTLVGSCHSHGDLPCYVGFGCASCPAGTVVTGGGCNATPAQYGAISQSYPSGSTQWCCGSSYDFSSTDLAYAICARVGN